ncbi:MAG TPA: hypothetical protein VLD39_18495 [Gammaproteobacteria bacterium]|nr:hypothetical protein [Gammaproteobacteria bacterium]
MTAIMLNFVRRLFGGKRKSPPRPRRSATHLVLGARNSAGFPVVKQEALEIDSPKDDDGFDPYNTGMFNRSGSWERINKRRNS